MNRGIRLGLILGLIAAAACGGAEKPPPKSQEPIRQRANQSWDDLEQQRSKPPAAPKESALPQPRTQPQPAPISTSAETLRRCDAKQDHWTTSTPRSDQDAVFGVGRGATIEQAFERGRAEAAKSIEVTVATAIEDTQVDWQSAGTGSNRSQYESKVQAVSRSTATRRMSECRQVEACEQAPGHLAALISCAKHGALEKEIANAAKALCAQIPPKSTLLLIPGTDSSGAVTGFGEYVMHMERGELSRNAPKDASLLKLPSWTPTDLRELARKYGATLFVRLEHTNAGQGRQRLSTWLQDAGSDKSISAVVSFDVELDTNQQGLLAVQGPLLPQKGAMDLADNLSEQRVDLKLDKTRLDEGEKVRIDVTVKDPSYVYLFDIYEDGQVAPLFPSAISTNNYVPRGGHLQLPDENWVKHGMALLACPIPGRARTREIIKAVASNEPVEFVDSKSDGSSVSPETIVKKLGALQRSGIRFADASVAYEIRAHASANSPCRAASNI